jgi:hypothetical protein
MTLEIAKNSVNIRIDNGNFCESCDVEGTSETKINVAGKHQLTLVGLNDNGYFMDHSVRTYSFHRILYVDCPCLQEKNQSPWEMHHHLLYVLSDKS